MKRQALCLAAGMALAACASIPLTSMPKLAALKPETLDLAAVELAVRVQEEFKLYRDGARLSVLLKRADGTRESLDLIMAPIEDGLTPFLRQEQKSGMRIARYRVDPKDVSRVDSFREEMLALKDTTPPGSNMVTISATAGGCFERGGNPLQGIRMKLYLRTSPDKDYFILFKEQKLALRTGEKSENGENGIRYCSDKDRPRLLLSK